MIVIPAVDLIDGKPVRLYQGDYQKKKVVAESPVETAAAFEEAGAERIHIVDLDGARMGRRVNHQLIADMVSHVHMESEVGGGIRTFEDIEWYLDHGADTVILGTAALKDPEFLKQALKQYQNHIAIGLDCKDGYARGSGWLDESQYYYTDFARRLKEMGAQYIIYTDISKDGTLQGPAFDQLAELKKNAGKMKITASGGIHNLEDIKKLMEMHLYGAITGQAVYSGSLNLKEAVRLTKERR